mmetsp:Transcript_43575/g.49435  ORF Transcript_43575/g.49435 Transcript_43575/m.49435 type:complete len:177 (-) Transcript_43575:273-803(-)
MEWENIYPKNNTRLLRDVLESDSSNCPDVAKCELFKQQWEMGQRKFGGIEGALMRLGLRINDRTAPTLISSYRTPASKSALFVVEEADGTLRYRTDDPRPRFLTPKEFRRIMGFPDTFRVTSPPRIISGKRRTNDDETIDGHIYKVLGNAVVPPVIEAIGGEILRLKEEVEGRRTQ